LGSSVTNIHNVLLTKAATFTADGRSNLTITGSKFNDTIIAGGSGQTLTGGAGVDTLEGSTAGGDTFKDTAANLNGDTIENFGFAGDAIDVTNIKAAGATANLVGNTLTIANGTATTSITLTGSLMNSFHVAADSKGDALVTYTGTPPAPPGVMSSAALQRFSEAMANLGAHGAAPSTPAPQAQTRVQPLLVPSRGASWA
jgi:Ca2+-binding RTX toxin-like protein